MYFKNIKWTLYIIWGIAVLMILCMDLSMNMNDQSLYHILQKEVKVSVIFCDMLIMVNRSHITTPVIHPFTPTSKGCRVRCWPSRYKQVQCFVLGNVNSFRHTSTLEQRLFTVWIIRKLLNTECTIMPLNTCNVLLQFRRVVVVNPVLDWFYLCSQYPMSTLSCLQFVLSVLC